MSKIKPLSPIEKMLQQAFALWQSGLLQDAKVIYQKLLKSIPRNPDLLTNLGTIELQMNNLETGVELIERSLKIHPNQPHAISNLGNGLFALKRYEEAIRVFDLSISLNPGLPQVFYNRGNAYRETGRFNEALANYESAIKINPNYAEAYNNRGITFNDLGNVEHAIQDIEYALKLHPNYAAAYFNLGVVFKEIKKFKESINCFEFAVKIMPDYEMAYYNLGNILLELKRYEEAVAYFDKVILINHNNAEAFLNRGVALQELKKFSEALASFDRVILLSPMHPDAYLNRGVTLESLKRFDEAIQDFDRAISLNPTNAEAYSNLGITENHLKHYDNALAKYDEAISIDPKCAEAYSNRGITLGELKKYDEALINFDQAIALNPDIPEAYWNKSTLLLLQGKFEEGWKLYEWRWEGTQKEHRRHFSQPLWLGEYDNLHGKTILIYPEQGLGDVIQFCRYIPMIEDLGATVLFAVHPSLKSLVATMDANFTIIENGTDLPDFDLQCPIMSLPLAFKTTLETIPSEIPYLYADSDKIKDWKRVLGDEKITRIGLVWSGSTIHKNDHNRSLLLNQLEPILQLPFEFHCLQKEIRPTDQASLDAFKQIHQHQDQLVDFSDTAALICELDLVISVDTSVAHLAGALGKPVWILLPYAPDYRWMLDRPDSPWYPTATLFRQPGIDDWDSVISEVYKRLQALSSE